MHLNLKTKIWFTVLTIVLMFAFFILFYFPAQQEKYLLKNYNKEVQNLANTVALGVKIALTEQNFEGVETAMDFVKGDPHLQFIAMLQTDTLWNSAKSRYVLKKNIFRTYPDNYPYSVNTRTTDLLILKSAPYSTPVLSGEIVLGLSTIEIIQSKRQMRLTSMIVSSLVFVIGVVIGFWLAKNISVPVLALRDAAIKVGEGDRTQQVTTRSRDEIAELGKAFNKMVMDLKHAEERVKATQEQLVHSEKMASLGQMTAGIAHEIQNPLNFVNNFSSLTTELMKEYKESRNETFRVELFHNIEQNLEKIVLHGKRADRIMKGMLLHSRDEKEEKRLVNITGIIDENAGIAYHGFRSQHHTFSCSIEKQYSHPEIKISLVVSDFNRIIINLLNNAFYAMLEKSRTAGSNYKPTVDISVTAGEKFVTLVIKDNGSGIPDEVKEKIFNPFFTTKPTGEGTGLGLSLTYDMIKAHGGEINVESQKNEFTRFIINLPV